MSDAVAAAQRQLVTAWDALIEARAAAAADEAARSAAEHGATIDVSGQRNDEALTRAAPEGYTKVMEGTAATLCKVNADGTQEVFYNPAQVVNRDLSTLAIRGYDALRRERPTKKGRPADKGLRILEALSATGLRAIRYWKEIPNVEKIIVNDLLPEAVDAINRNLRYNRVPLTKVIANCDDAVHLMQRLAFSAESTFVDQKLLKVVRPAEQEPSTTSFTALPTEPSVSHPMCGEKMDVVDLDPYGTAAPFLDSALACAEEGGLLCVTCTDTDVLCGVHPEACHHKYGAITVKGKYCHELAVRVLLGCIERHANRHSKHIVPLLSCQIDFYVRVFIRVHTSKAETKLSIGKIGHVLQCTGCAAFRVKPIGIVKVEQQNREQRRNTARELKKKQGGRKRTRQEMEASTAEAPPAPEEPTADAAAAPEAAAEAPEASAELPNAALPPVPARSEPRLKYGTPTTAMFQSTEHPPTAKCSVCKSSVWVCVLSGFPPLVPSVAVLPPLPLTQLPSSPPPFPLSFDFFFSPSQIAGPIWSAPTHDKEYVEKLIKILDENTEQFKVCTTFQRSSPRASPCVNFQARAHTCIRQTSASAPSLPRPATSCPTVLCSITLHR